MRLHSLRRIGLAAVLVAVSVALPARADSPDVVISQLYTGGGNSGATFKNDFIELFNRGASPVDLTGWSVQYTSSAGSSWQGTNLTGITLLPGQYYLVQEAPGGEGTVPLPAPDAAGAIAMNSTSGKVALVTSTTLLTCGAAAGSCRPNPAIHDFVGFGTAVASFEGSGPGVALSNTMGAMRRNSGCMDSDDNAADFILSVPAPRNTASSRHPCEKPVVATGVGEGGFCGPSADGAACAARLVCCHPCGTPDCKDVCQKPCDPDQPGCGLTRCLIVP